MLGEKETTEGQMWKLKDHFEPRVIREKEREQSENYEEEQEGPLLLL